MTYSDDMKKSVRQSEPDALSQDEEDALAAFIDGPEAREGMRGACALVAKAVAEHRPVVDIASTLFAMLGALLPEPGDAPSFSDPGTPFFPDTVKDPDGRLCRVATCRRMLAEGGRTEYVASDIAEYVAEVFRGEGWTVAMSESPIGKHLSFSKTAAESQGGALPPEALRSRPSRGTRRPVARSPT
jgi:hypothetical protein